MKDNKIKNLILIRNIGVSLFIIVLLIWVFISNELVAKIIILPFLLCSLAFLEENIFTLFNKKLLVKIFHYIFIFSFLLYYYGFLIYIIYYSIKNKEYIFMLFTIPFWLFSILFLKNIFQKRSKKNV